MKCGEVCGCELGRKGNGSKTTGKRGKGLAASSSWTQTILQEATSSFQHERRFMPRSAEQGARFGAPLSNRLVATSAELVFAAISLADQRAQNSRKHALYAASRA